MDRLSLHCVEEGRQTILGYINPNATILSKWGCSTVQSLHVKYVADAELQAWWWRRRNCLNRHYSLMVWEYMTTRLQPKTGQIVLTEAAVPDRPRNRIEQEYLLHIKAIQRTERMQAWIFSSYSTHMTQDVLIAMRLCFPHGFISSWSAIEESSSFWSQKIPISFFSLSQMYRSNRTPFIWTSST